MLIPVNPPFHPFHHSITVNFLLDGNQGNMTKGDGIRSGRRHEFWATGSANLREILTELLGKAHPRASGSDFEGMINSRERDLIQTLLKMEGHPSARGMCFWSGPGTPPQGGRMHYKISDQQILGCSRALVFSFYPEIVHYYDRYYPLLVSPKSSKHRAFTRDAFCPSQSQEHCIVPQLSKQNPAWGAISSNPQSLF